MDVDMYMQNDALADDVLHVFFPHIQVFKFIVNNYRSGHTSAVMTYFLL